MNSFEPYLPVLKKALQRVDEWRSFFGEEQQVADHLNMERTEEILLELGKRLEGNYPFHHPQYAGQMLKPPHPVAWLAYTLAATINPNNHALDGGPPTSGMEKEVVAELAEMAGYGDGYLGHLTSGGTIANLEALFVAREIHPRKAIAASSNAHYTHRRMCRVLGVPFLEIPVDAQGSPDMAFIKKHAGDIGTLVVTMGTTGLGIAEPLGDLTGLAQKHGIRIHADAAYGGFFKLISSDLPSRLHWDWLQEADSIVIDPHKHGLQPYGCGSVLYKDASAGSFFKHDSPYTYFTSDELHLGEISLECSRAGASAAALWATLRLLPLTRDGLGSILQKTRSAAIRFAEKLEESSSWELYARPDLDIVGYFRKPEVRKISSLNKINREVFERGMADRKTGYHLSLFTLPGEVFRQQFPEYLKDEEQAVILRSVFMKEEHEGFIEELAKRLAL